MVPERGASGAFEVNTFCLHLYEGAMSSLVRYLAVPEGDDGVPHKIRVKKKKKTYW